MRGKMLMLLALMCLLLAGAGWMAHQAQVIAEEYARLQREILMLEVENVLLREKVAELREQQAELGSRMEKWLDEWEVQEAEITGYAPLDARAIPGMCYSGDPRVTSSGAKTTPGITAAAPENVPFGTRVYIPSRGEMRVVQDRGGRVGYTEDGVMQLDLCVETREEALDMIERQKVKTVWQRSK